MKNLFSNTKKAFEIFPLLLELGMHPQDKRQREFIVVNDDKSFSTMKEKIEIMHDAKIDMVREKQNKSYRTTAMLCHDIKLSPRLLLPLN